VAAGALILIGVCVCSRILALSVIGGTFVASLLSLAVFDVPTAYLNAGYAGFNPALAVAGIFFYLVPSWKLYGLAIFWLILTMIATGAIDVLLDLMYVPLFVRVRVSYQPKLTDHHTPFAPCPVAFPLQCPLGSVSLFCHSFR
jgi:urea transporter